MKISDVRRIISAFPMTPAWRASGRALPRSTALDIVMVEVTTDNGLTGWGDAFSYVCPRTTLCSDQ